MACVIAAPASGSGKTLLSLVLSSWARHRNLSIQAFKVGPDYLDPQILSSVSNRPCRNLDLILCGHNWVEETYFRFGCSADMTVVEGVMGLFDGIGSSRRGSTADLAKFLKLPIVLVVDGRGQAASLAALVKGFKDHDSQIELAGVVLNHINTNRHKRLLGEVLEEIGVKILGCLPDKIQLNLPCKNLGLAPAHEIKDLEKRIDSWAAIAESYLDLTAFKRILESPKESKNQVCNLAKQENKKPNLKALPVAIAEDKAFHFRYPETKECLEKLGVPFLTWKPIEDEPIPKQAKGLIIPGGFPEQYAERLSHCSRSIKELRKFYGYAPIYAECGGMLLLGRSLTDLNGRKHQMAEILPFDAMQGPLSIGYRTLKCKKDGLIINKGDELIGHEFHRWKLKPYKQNQFKLQSNATNKIDSLWASSGWDKASTKEGWGNKFIHASWIHLHWPSSAKIMRNWRSAINSQ